MEISYDEWKYFDRVDNIFYEQAMLLSRINSSDFISASEPSLDRLGKLSVRVDFRKRWVDISGRRRVRRLSVRISEIRGGYSYTQFAGRNKPHLAFARNWESLSIYDRVMLLT